MIKRHITPYLHSLARAFPVVSILGTRQSGKTTLARSEFPDHEYLNLEDPATRDDAEKDYRGFFAAHPGPLILDEIQRVPKLLSAIQVLVDEKREPGKYILTGSHQPLLRAGITQSLAGRVGIAQLWPLSVAELSDAGINLDRDEYLFRGFLPGHYANAVSPSQLFTNYYSTYVERDVRQLVNVEKQNAFELFVKLLAGRVGQLVNLNSMSGEIGVTAHTLASWLSVLEASYIVFRLQPYYSNFGKRMVKTPKLYFTEPGLATWLLGITSPEQVVRDPLAGGLFENMVVAEAFKARSNAGLMPELYFFRSHDGLEIDLLLNKARRLLPMEIKASRSFSTSLARTLRLFQKVSDSIFSPAVLYAGDMETVSKGITYAHFKNTAKIINNANPPP
jgi:predicted AAA+ superfamily ATPase